MEAALVEEDEAQSTCEAAKCSGTIAGRRAAMVMQVVRGEAAVLRALKEACHGADQVGVNKRGKKRKKRKKKQRKRDERSPA